MTGSKPDDAICADVHQVLTLIGNRWTVEVMVTLRDEPKRFNAIRRTVSGISQQMLARTLKALELDGLLWREVYATNPPQVTYGLTDLGRSLLASVGTVAQWAVDHHGLPADRARAILVK